MCPLLQRGMPALHPVPAMVHELVALHGLPGDCVYTEAGKGEVTS